MDTQQHGSQTMTIAHRGVALITTLAGVVVVTMLVLAFLATQRGQHSLTALSLEKKACREAARSVAEFCRFQLEGQESWARPGSAAVEPVEFRDGTGDLLFSLSPLTREVALAKPEFANLSGEVYLEGSLPGDDVRFAATVTNNLARKSAHPLEPVGPQACLLKIRAWRGETLETVEVVLRKAAFFDSTIATTGDITIEADAIDFASADRLRNQVRSKSDVSLPPSSDIKFSPHPDSRNPEKGTVWAAGEIAVGGNSSEAALLLAADATGGEFLAKAPTFYEVPQLRQRDIESRTAKPIAELAAGNYGFTEVKVTFKDTDGETHEQVLTVLGLYSEPGWEMTEFHFCEADLRLEAPDPPPTPDPATPPPPGPAPDASTVVLGTLSGTPQPEHEFPLGGFTMTIGSAGSGNFTLPAESDYRVAGNLSLFGSNPEAPAVLSFVDNDPNPAMPEEGSLSVTMDLAVGCSLSNCGKLVAGRDIHLSPRDVTIDKLEEGNDLAIYAGRDVLIAPMFNGDEALRNDTRRLFVFRGIIYAERDFSFLSSTVRGAERLDEYNRDLFIEGAVVARQGEVLIQGNEEVQLKYNREFLDDLLERSTESNQVHLEEMSSRPR